MKIGIIHFNSKHLREAGEDHTMGFKREEIFLSLRNRLAEFEQVFILISEPGVFPAGEEDEQVKLFYRNIKSDLGMFSNRGVSIVGAPWERENHFENVESGWKHIIESLEKERIREKSLSMVLECCSPQLEDGYAQEDLQLNGAKPKLHSEKFMNLYGESEALLDSENINKSHFNMLSFDSDKAKICVSNFNYDKGCYHENRIESDQELPGVESKGEQRYALNKSFSDQLDSLDAEFLNRGAEKCKADHLCVNPFLKFINPGTNKTSIGRFNKLLDEGKLDKAILIGDGGAGKTFLSKKLFKHFHAEGFTPLLVNGYEILKPDIHFITNTLFRQAFENYYLTNNLGHSGEVDKAKIVLIVDDFNGCRLRGKYRNLFVKNLNAQVDKVIFCSKSIMFFNSIDPYELSDYQTYRLVEYSFKLGGNLIGK